MKKTAELLVVGGLLLSPGLTLAGYGQNNTQTGQPSSTPPTSQQPSTSAPPAASSPSTPSSSPSDSPATDTPGPPADQKMPGVKAGSVDDVNAVGTRDIGGGG